MINNWPTNILFRAFEKPVISESRLQENKDALLLWISIKLKSKSRVPGSINFHNDCYRHLFLNKGNLSQNRKWRVLEKTDFDHCKFHNTWDQCLDSNGDGVVVKFPINMRPLISWSPKMFTVNNGLLTSATRMPVKRLVVDFDLQPFSMVNVNL